jgi:hypothetical protein
VSDGEGICFPGLVAAFIKESNDMWWFIQVNSSHLYHKCFAFSREIQLQGGGRERCMEGMRRLLSKANRKQECVRFSG